MTHYAFYVPLDPK